MPMRDATTSAPVSVAPPCLKCQQPFNVRPLHVTEADPCVQYWSCEGYGFVWASRDGEDLRSLAADRTPRKSP
jgi:hypothetical protein